MSLRSHYQRGAANGKLDSMVSPLTFKHWIFFLAGTAAIFAAGYGLGLNTSDLVSETAPANCPAISSSGTVYSLPWDGSAGTVASSLLSPSSPSPAASPSVSTLPTLPAASVASGDILAALTALPADADSAERDRLLSSLSSAIGTDAGLRRRAVAAYLKGAEGPFSEILGMALAAGSTPELEKDLVDASGANQPAPNRLASLRLLGAIGLRTQESRAALLESLHNGSTTDPTLTAATLSALSPRGPVSTSELATVTATLSTYVQSQDSIVRQQAIDAYVAWGPREPSTVQLLKSAIQDADAEVRSTAASAMAVAGGNGADVQAILLARMLDEREVLDVRKAAASSLGSFPMAPATMSAHANFSATHLREP